MNTNELASILNGYFSWNKSRMECFAGMLIALIKVRTVNLTGNSPRRPERSEGSPECGTIVNIMKDINHPILNLVY